jgi:diketogulonate reductase-like aldo/keto reductase
MHCDTTVDPEGTWRQSWRTLEKAYAEGRVMSIGVSNFDLALLEELLEFASVKPHVVQNFAEPGSVDNAVRRWCRDHEVIYQPYAAIRNLNQLPREINTAIHRIAAEKAVSTHSVAIRFFIQSGSGVIPRSKDENHLKENLEAFGYELSEVEMTELGWEHSEL